MKYTINHDADECVVSVSGMITFDDHSAMKGMIGELDESEADKVVLDLAQMKAVDSAGIGLLLLLNDNLSNQGRSLALINIQ
ncbi:MAG: STAS domain-containing protein, partial [Alphaproteobacteria bacterium]|nr:STAS domain-containing protein [Alphaproteobacteria bacterium]